jgi:hypothetical protein
MSRETKSVPYEEVGARKTGMLLSLLSERNSKDIITADECGLFLSLLPHKTYTFKDESWHGGKRKNNKLTELV